MKILLTGATGLLGREVTKQLLQEGHEVTAVQRNAGIDLDSRVKVITLDLGSDWDLQKIDFDFEGVIHLAQSREFRNFPGGSQDVFSVNVSSTHKLLELARRNKCKSFVFASSGGIYAASNGSISENSPLEKPGDLGFYLGSKACGEIICQSYSTLLTTVILRPFFIYGTGQNREMLLPRLFDLVSSGKEIKIETPNGMECNPVHVYDAASLVVKSLFLDKSQVINVAGPARLSLKEIVDAIGDAVGRRPVITRTSLRAKNLSAEASVMTALLGRDLLDIRNHIHELMPSTKPFTSQERVKTQIEITSK